MQSWFSGSSAKLLEIRLPSRQLRPPEAGKRGVAFEPGYRRAEQESDFRFLRRASCRLHWWRILAAAVDLAIGLRIHRRRRAARTETSTAARCCRSVPGRPAPWHTSAPSAKTGARPDRSRRRWQCSRCCCFPWRRKAAACWHRPPARNPRAPAGKPGLRSGHTARRRHWPGRPSTLRQSSHSAGPGSQNHARRRARDRPRWRRSRRQ